ncbi:hypothetical protein KHQ88_04060 [Mycoplasmatota bacterium]|nr:hypothetical protein KHQ88_04060 [Mycoplasmatota bacterium]
MEEMNHQIQHDKVPLKSDGLLDMNEVASKFKFLMSESKYKQALFYLNGIKNDPHLLERLDIIKLHDLYIDVLLKIEDFRSLENILKSKQKYIESDKERNMHQFYLAICYEGLSKIDEAILALEKIDDTISSHNLVNKYLKLALLYLQNKDFNQAIKAYDYAIVFDRKKEYEIFLLVESDIQFYQKNYVESMKLFEDFFIKTKRKLSYLNRFIRISLALKRFDDVFEFYKRYKDKVLKHESIQIKLSFFNEIIDFLKNTDHNEYIEINNYLAVLRQRDIVDFDYFDYYQVVLKHLRKHKIYKKERDIVRDLFIDLNQTLSFKKLAYIEVNNGELRIYHLSKNLLLEKTLENNHTIFNDILSDNIKQSYIKPLINDFIFVQDDTDYVFIEGLDDQRFLLTYTDEKSFDLAKKLTLLSKHLLIDKFKDFYLRSQQANQFEAINQLLSKTNYGLIKIHLNQVYLLNDEAKRILGKEDLIIDFNLLQKSFDPVIYLDEFYHQSKLLSNVNGQEILMHAISVHNDLFVLLSVHDHKQKQVLLKDLKANDQKSMVLIDLHNYHKVINDCSSKEYLNMIEKFKEHIYKFSNQHVLEIFIEANHMFYVLLDTRDKRIPERLGQKLIHEYHHVLDIRLVFQPFNEDIDVVLKRLFDMLKLTSKDNALIMNDKIVKRDDENRHIYLETIQSLIKHKKPSLIYHYVKNWKNNSVRYIDVELNDLNILKDQHLLKSVLKQNQLNIQFDRLIVNQLINELKHISFNSQWIIPISIESIQSKKAFNYLLRRLDLIDKQHVVFKIPTQDYLDLSQEDKKYLKEKNIETCLIDLIDNISDLNIYENHQMIMIDKSAFNNDLYAPILDMISKNVKAVIYNHENHRLIKTDLEKRKIDLVKGDFSGHTDKIKQ